jgi:glycosyltransferase involved in cell wall biosynthesis
MVAVSSHVAIAIPCFGQAHFLGDAVESLKGQTYPHWTAAVVFPRSDESVVCRAIDGNTRFALIPRPPMCLAAARNAGVRQLAGEYIVTLDADDVLAPTYLARAVAVLDADPSVRVVYSRICLFGAETGPPNIPPYSLAVLRARNVLPSSAMCRRSDFARVGGYDEKLSRALEDWEFWISVLKDGAGSVVQLPTVEFFYRRHAQSMSVNWPVDEWLEAREYIRAKHGDFCT